MEAENLIEIARIKNLCKQKGVNKINQKTAGVVFYFSKDKFNIDSVNKLIDKYKSTIKFSPSALPYITYKIDANKSIIKQVKDFLKEI